MPSTRAPAPQSTNGRCHDRLRQQPERRGSPVRPAPSEGESPRQRSGLAPTRATNGMTIPVNESDAKAPTSDASADVARVLLDSTVLIDALRGRPAGEHLRALRRQGDEPWTSAISIEEIWRGLLPGEEAIAQRLVRGL